MQFIQKNEMCYLQPLCFFSLDRNAQDIKQRKPTLPPTPQKCYYREEVLQTSCTPPLPAASQTFQRYHCSDFLYNFEKKKVKTTRYKPGVEVSQILKREEAIASKQ